MDGRFRDEEGRTEQMKLDHVKLAEWRRKQRGQYTYMLI